MSEIHWIKILTGIFEDEKIRIIQSMPDGDALLVLWFKLLTQAGKSNRSGYVCLNEETPYTEDMLAVIFGKSPQLIKFALRTFTSFGMIEIDERGFIDIVNWEKHQSVDKMDKIREQARLRKQKEREKKKSTPLLSPIVTQSHAHVTHGHATDIDIELDKEKDIKNIVDANASTPPKRFIKPTIEQVISYCQERNNTVDAHKWFDHYESNGWKVGKNSMKDWKAAVRTWEKNSNTSIRPNGTSYTKPDAEILGRRKDAELHDRYLNESIPPLDLFGGS